MSLKKNKSSLPKDFLGAVTLLFIVSCVYLNFEPIITNAADTDTITVTAVVSPDVAITSPGNILLSGLIGGVGGGSAIGRGVWNVKTSNSTGYNLKVKADKVDTLDLGASHFDDYTLTPTYAWTLASGSGFGFTVNMPVADAGDTVTAFKDNGTICGASGTANSDDSCWSGFNSTTNIDVVNRTTPTAVAGTNVTLAFEAALVSGTILPPGDYVASITVTAAVNIP